MTERPSRDASTHVAPLRSADAWLEASSVPRSTSVAGILVIDDTGVVWILRRVLGRAVASSADDSICMGNGVTVIPPGAATDGGLASVSILAGSEQAVRNSRTAKVITITRIRPRRVFKSLHMLRFWWRTVPRCSSRFRIHHPAQEQDRARGPVPDEEYERPVDRHQGWP